MGVASAIEVKCLLKQILYTVYFLVTLTFNVVMLIDRAGAKEKFSFLTHPFILSPATKSVGLFFDNRVRMISERRASIFQALFQGSGTHPYLKLSINRNNVVPDAMLAVCINPDC